MNSIGLAIVVILSLGTVIARNYRNDSLTGTFIWVCSTLLYRVPTVHCFILERAMRCIQRVHEHQPTRWISESWRDRRDQKEDLCLQQLRTRISLLRRESNQQSDLATGACRHDRVYDHSSSSWWCVFRRSTSSLQLQTVQRSQMRWLVAEPRCFW